MTPSPDPDLKVGRQRGDQLALAEPRAESARYEVASGRVIVDLTNGCTSAFPARALQGLGEASDRDLAQVEVSGFGCGLHWETLDADFTVPGLLMGLFGTRAWIAREQARIAGAVRSPAKATAARENGRKGGRPRRVGEGSRLRVQAAFGFTLSVTLSALSRDIRVARVGLAPSPIAL